MSELISDLGRSGILMFTGSIPWNPGQINNQSGVNITLSVDGASRGDYVIVTSDKDVQGLMLTGNIVSSGTARIGLNNLTGSTITPDSTAKYFVLALTRT